MKLYPLALAKTFIVLSFSMFILNLIQGFAYFGAAAVFASLKNMQFLLESSVNLVVAGVAGYLIARLYNHFLPAQN